MISPVIYAVANSDKLTETEYENARNIVSVSRRERAEKYRRREDSFRSLIAEVLVKFTIKKLGFTDYNQVLFSANQYGKPQANIEGFHFNVSHSGSWVVCAADSLDVGVDVERIHKVDTGIAKRFFSQEESELLAHCTSESQWQDLFFKLWSLKESYIKAIGKGLSCSLGSFAVLPENESVKLIRHDQTLPVKYLKVYNLDEAYRCALCCSSNNFPQSIIICSAESVIKELTANK